jgi:hypothetical protein
MSRPIPLTLDRAYASSSSARAVSPRLGKTTTARSWGATSPTGTTSTSGLTGSTSVSDSKKSAFAASSLSAFAPMAQRNSSLSRMAIGSPRTPGRQCFAIFAIVACAHLCLPSATGTRLLGSASRRLSRDQGATPLGAQTSKCPRCLAALDPPACEADAGRDPRRRGPRSRERRRQGIRCRVPCEVAEGCRQDPRRPRRAPLFLRLPRRALGPLKDNERDRVDLRDGASPDQGHQGSGLASRRPRDGIQASRVCSRTLALDQRPEARRARASRSEVQKGGVGRERSATRSARSPRCSPRRSVGSTEKSASTTSADSDSVVARHPNTRGHGVARGPPNLRGCDGPALCW